LRDWANALLRTGMFEQAARIFGVLGERANLLKALDRRQSSFNKITKSMGIPSLTCLLVRLSLLNYYCKSSFMTIAGFINELNSEETKCLLDKVLGYYKQCSLPPSANLEVFSYLILTSKLLPAEPINSEEARDILNNKIDFTSSNTLIFQQIQAVVEKFNS